MHAPDLPTYTVGELNRLIRRALAQRFPDEVWVEGEIRGLKRHERSGHVYFELVDSSDDGRQTDAVIQVALYRNDKEAVNRLLKRVGAVRMDDGVHIRIRGAIDYYPPQGRLQLRMRWIDPEHTLGRLEAERRRLLEALRAEGLLEQNANLPYPLLPLRVGLVTSAGSAAHHDFVHELDASGLAWKVTFAHAAVQGPDAATEVVAALHLLVGAGVDVVALIRGGGARTDLAAFDDETLARTISSLPVPVLTGIGHETDQVVADLVAARRAKTPTACAALLVADAVAAHDRARRAWDAIASHAEGDLRRGEHRLERLAAELSFAGRRHVDRRRSDLDTMSDRLVRRAPQIPDRAADDIARVAAGIAAAATRRIERGDVVVGEHRRALATSAPRALRRRESELAATAALVAAADPTRLLARGWSIVRTADGGVVSSVAGLSGGDELVTTVADGTVRSRVLGTSFAGDDPSTTSASEIDEDGP